MAGNVFHIISCLEDGGAQAVLFRLCTQDAEDSHQVISLTGAGKYGPMLEARGIPVTSLDMPRGRVTLSGLWRLWRLLRAARPDAIQTWMYHANLLGGGIARLAGHRNIVWGIRHSTLIPGTSPRSTIWVAKLCAWLSRFVPRRIVCCAEKSRAVHAALGYDARRMCVIPNGYDLSLFQPDANAGATLRRDLGLAPEASVIGFVARLDPQKDHKTLLRALALLKEKGNCPICLLVGTDLDPANNALGAIIDALGLRDRIRLMGRRGDIPAVMNALDLHVMSSSFGEAFPNVLAEAMACGTPCVSTDVGDAAVILGDTGWIVPPRNSEALAEAIATALHELGGPNRNVRRDAARRRVAEHFSIDRMVRSYRAAWRQTPNRENSNANR
jgi:glycosyltransferase involved in cell wall biosynthesis